MGTREKKRLFNDTAMRLILLVLGSIASTLVLAFSVLSILEVNKGSFETAPRYLIWVFVFLGVTRILTFIKDRTRLNLIRCLSLLIYDVALGLIILFAKTNLYIFSLSAGLYCLSIVVSRVFKIVQQRTVRSIILNSLIIAFVAILSIGMFIPTDKAEVLSSIVLIECVFIALTAFIEVMEEALSKLRFKVLFKIIVRTFALEIIFGLLTAMVASSLVLMTIEPVINNFPDALWYSFAVVTTIGFGDFAAETLLGRIITVFLGLYGIIVVAVITSIIVNFYNETSGKEDQKQLKDIKQEENKDKK